MDLISVIVLAIVCIVIGVLVTSLYHAMSGGKGESAQAKAVPAGMEETARLLRDARSDDLVVEIGGRTYVTANDLGPGDRQRLSVAAINLRNWLEIFPSTSSGKNEVPFVTPAPESGSISLAELTSGKRRTARAANEPEPVEKLPSSFFAPSMPETEASAYAKSARSIAEQIDDILQAKLDGTALDSLGIRLMQIPGKGMAVMVGLDKYDEVEAIPDPQIRSIIQEAVAEWENQFSSFRE